MSGNIIIVLMSYCYKLVRVPAMALYSYFQRATSTLPSPDVPLSAVVPPSTIAAANSAPVTAAGGEQPTLTPKRGSYEHCVAL